jgi:large subunit ribosomal protein L17
MRHQVAGYKLGRSKGARIALRRNLIKQFFTHERITTTRTKAEAIRGEAEHMITIARHTAQAEDIAKVNARRLIAARLGGGNEVVKKLFDDIAPRFANRNGGYTRMLKLGPRLGDAAEMVMLELVEE